ncbi:ankyrin repeat domain protein [Wolbachia endosymbiont of Armadillidium vulgare str. wVulC]|uniref:ankyrin repeat domain-containing protein n=1 Tax=Wolbachia endosymbiont of Armadillidium vulgare TaxID=77039 RepID=UPI0006D4C56D|nr:ankyrin repeat domain-containing protein [Wolbachia endosymbiont of Armadillidium vulgare]KLT22609.1 ankyrin repeat domain protein [Wolbachia endosymbiont of Armadillidium vulgare str. wVulC]
MVMTYEQWNIILGVIDQEVNLSKDNVIERIKELLKEVKILGQAETSRMLEEISHGLEVSSKIPRVQETQEPLKKRLKVVNVPQTPEEAKKILKETGISNAQKMVKRMLKRLGVKETSGESKAVVLEDMLDALKISEKVPVMLDARETLKALEVLKRESRNMYKKWEENEFNVNYWFTVNYNILRSAHDQHTLLSLAISLRLKNVVDALLKVKRISINAKSPFFEWTALHWAAEKGNVEIVLKLIEKGASVNQFGSCGWTALHLAAANGNIEIIKILVKNRANVNQKNVAKLTALYEAVRNRHKEVTKFLLLNGADVKENGACEVNVLHLAIMKNDKEMVECIIENDKNIRGDINMTDAFGRTPLYLAATNNYTSLLEILLQNGADDNIEDRLSGFTPLHIAVISGSLQAVELLLKHNKAKLKFLEEFKVLLQNGAYDNLKDRLYVRTPLWVTAINKILEEVELLLEHNKAYINRKDRWGWTAFDYAFIRNDRELIDILIGHGADMNIKDPLKILFAVSPSNIFVARPLLEQLEVCDDFSKLIQAYSLHYAAAHGDIQSIRYLLESGVDVNAISDSGLTPLHYAANNGHEKVAEILISHEAAVNLQDNLGIIPLGYAIDGKHLKTIKTLIPCTNLLLQDNCGETVKDLDERKGASNFSDKAEKRVRALRERVRALRERVRALRERVTPLVNDIANVQSKPSTEVCPAKIDGIKERRAHSPCRWTYRKRKLSTEMDSDSSTETDECNDRWSYGR